MDTRTGEIHNRDEHGRRVRDVTRETPQEHLEAELRMAEAEARGDLVPVSDHVAKLMRSAQDAELKRKRRRKGAKNARKKNRGKK